MNGRILRAAVCFLLLFSFIFAVPAQAADTEDIIYVSDLYYGYDTAYMSVPLGNYSIATTKIMADVYEDFINNPAFIWTTVSGSLSAVTTPKQMFQIVSDAMIDTKFTYNQALTAANEKLALGLLQMPTGDYELRGMTSAIVEKINSTTDLMSIIFKDCDLQTMTDYEIIDTFFQNLVLSSPMQALSTAQLDLIRSEILDNIGLIGDMTTLTTSTLDIINGLYMTLVVEDARLLMIDYLLPLAEERSTLHDGLTLLQNQFELGFTEYFIHNYLFGEGLDLATTLGKNYLAGVCAPAVFAAGIIEIANNVVFDVIFDVPSVDEFMLQTVLAHYSMDLYELTDAQLEVFENPFDSIDAVEFEILYTAYSTAVSEGLKATERLASEENISRLNSVMAQYGNYTYQVYIARIISDLYEIDPDKRVTKSFTWSPSGSIRVHEACDTMEAGYIYEFRGAIHGDFVIKNTLIIDEDQTCTITGDLLLSQTSITVHGALHVMGNMEIASGWAATIYQAVANHGTVMVDGNLSMTYYKNTARYTSYFSNYGTLEVGGDLSLTTDRCFFSMDDENAVLKVKGNISAPSTSAWKCPENGTIILNGSVQQSITNLAVHDLTIENPQGVAYLSDILLYGAFRPNGAPLECHTYWLQLSYDASLVGDNAHYGNVNFYRPFTSSDHGTFQNIKVQANLTIPAGICWTVEEDITHTNSTIDIQGTLHVAGNINTSSGWSDYHYDAIANHGTVQIDGDLIMSYTKTASTYTSYFSNYGSLTVGGDLLLERPRCFFSMAGPAAELILGGDCPYLLGSDKFLATNGTVRILAAEHTDALIAALVPATTVAAEQARASYNNLSAFQQKYVTNYAQLTAAEAKLTQANKFSTLGANMTLGSTLHLNFALDRTALPDIRGCTAVLTKMIGDQIDKTVVVPSESWRNTEAYYLIPYPLAAKEMGDTVYMEIFDENGNAISENTSDSVQNYAMRTLESETSTVQVKQMIVDMLIYGAAAQTFFDYETYTLADSLLTEEQKSLASEDVSCRNNLEKGDNYYGSNLSLESSILLNVFFSGLEAHDINQMYAEISFTDIHGKEHRTTVPGTEFILYRSRGGIYKIVIDEIAVGDACQPVSVCVYKSDGTRFGSCTDSVESYVNRAFAAEASPLYAAIMRFAHSSYLYLTTR